MAITRFYIPTRFIIGPDSLFSSAKRLPDWERRPCWSQVPSSMRSTGTFDKVTPTWTRTASSGYPSRKSEPNPRASTIDEGAKFARENGVDVVIGLGGGSVMDATKCLALAASGTDPIFEYYEGKANSKTALPIILVPTVAASGSEANNGAVFTNWETHEKVVIIHPAIYPRVSIVDPVLTLTLPAKTTAQGGVDIFCHLVEQYITAEESTLINDALRESSMRTVVDALPRFIEEAG